MLSYAEMTNPSSGLGFSQVVAGNGAGSDNGDLGQATNASLFHPRGLAIDSTGNLYVSTENGFIRKIDPSGQITRFAGLPLSQGGLIADQIHASQLALNRPTGMIVDNQNQYH
jgi:hypothetical protein